MKLRQVTVAIGFQVSYRPAFTPISVRFPSSFGVFSNRLPLLFVQRCALMKSPTIKHDSYPGKVKTDLVDKSPWLLGPTRMELISEV